MRLNAPRMSVQWVVCPLERWVGNFQKLGDISKRRKKWGDDIIEEAGLNGKIMEENQVNTKKW